MTPARGRLEPGARIFAAGYAGPTVRGVPLEKVLEARRTNTIDIAVELTAKAVPARLVAILNHTFIDGSEGDIIIKRKISGTTRDVLKFDASAAAMYIGSNGNEGDLRILDNSGRESFIFDGASGALYLGATENEGNLRVRDNSGNDAIFIDGGSAAVYIGRSGNEGDLRIRDNAGNDVFNFDGLSKRKVHVTKCTAEQIKS